MTRVVRWLFPAVAATEEYPARAAEQRDVTLGDDDWLWYQQTGERALALPPGPERSQLIGEIHVVMEMNAYADASFVPDARSEAQAASYRASRPEPQQLAMLPPPEGTKAFPIPEKARRKMAKEAGFEADNATQSSLDQPGDLGPQAVPDEVDRVREAAIAKADAGVTQSWRDHADEMILKTAKRLPEFTSEDVWDSGLRRPHVGSSDGDALGPAMRRAKDAGIIEDTGRRTEKTSRPQRHNNPKRIWRSLVYGRSDVA